MSKKKAIKAMSLLWVGSLLGAGCAFLLQVLLARKLGPSDFGTFTASLTTVTMLAPLAGFGISQHWLKVFGQEGWAATRWLPASFRFIILSTLLVLVILGLWGELGPHDEYMRIIILVLSLHVVGLVIVDLVSSKLQLEERYLRLALWQLVPHLMRLALVAVLAFWATKFMDASLVAVAYAAIAIILTFSGIIQLRCMSGGQFELKGHLQKQSSHGRGFPDMKTVVKEAWPFGFAGMFYLVYYQSNIILLKYMVGSAAAGVYNVAFTVMVAVYLLPGVIFQKYLLPKTHRWANNDRARFYQVYRQGNIAMLILGVMVMLAIWVLAALTIPVLFGEKYRDSIVVLNILAICAPVFFLAISVGSTLVTQEHMKEKVKLMGIVAVINIFLNLSLIPFFGTKGAAVSSVISNMLLLVLYYNFAQKIVFKDEVLALK
jgi:O-antigen/teichoic acid export membrane protein